MSFSNYLETKVLDHVFGGVAYTAPTTLYVALYTAAPGEAGGGTECSGTNYSRQTVTFTTTGDTTTNDSAIEYSAAGNSWGTLTYAGIFDASSGGNLLTYAALTVSKTIDTGDVLRIPAGEIDISIN